MRKDLAEDVMFDKEIRHDPIKGIVYNVKICGSKSVHGHRYTRQCQKKAIPLYEGQPVNVDHTPGRKTTDSRLYRERFGRIRKVNLQEGKKGPELRGNLHYNVKHPVAPQFAWDVDNDPNNCGLSHMASGSVVNRGGETLVESINFVRSVDLVADPATNTGLFEDRGGRMKRVKVRRKSALKSRRRRQLIEDMRELVEDSGNNAMVELFEAAVAEEPASDVGTPEEAMGKMLMAVWMDGSLELDEKRTKINSILDLAEEQEEEAPSKSEGEEEETPIPEDRGSMKKNQKKGMKTSSSNELIEDVASVKEELALLKKGRRIDELCEDAGFRPTKIQRRALLGLQRVSEVKELIESFNGAEEREPVTSKKPKAKGVNGKKPRFNDEDFDSKEFAESLFSSDN